MEHTLRPPVPPAQPLLLAESERHRDGMSCLTTTAYVYDANGHGRWCIDCGAELNEQASWHPDGADVPGWALAAAVTIVSILLVLVGILMTLPDPGTNEEPWGGPGTGVVPLPAPYGTPDAKLEVCS